MKKPTVSETVRTEGVRWYVDNDNMVVIYDEPVAPWDGSDAVANLYAKAYRKGYELGLCHGRQDKQRELRQALGL